MISPWACGRALALTHEELSMATIRAVLFDLDGVLIDSYKLWFHLLNDAAQHFKYPAISDKQFRDTWGQGIEEDIKAFYPGLTVEQLSRYFSEHYDRFIEHIEIIPGAMEALTSVKSLPSLTGRRRLTGVITNSQGGLARRVLEAKGMAYQLDRILGADDAGCSKPDPRGVQKLCRQLGIRPYEALMVGDSSYDEEAARGAGVHFVSYQRSARYCIQSMAALRPFIEWLESNV